MLELEGIESSYLAIVWWAVQLLAALSLAALAGGTLAGWVGHLFRVRENLLMMVGRAVAVAGLIWWQGVVQWNAFASIASTLWQKGISLGRL